MSDDFTPYMEPKAPNKGSGFDHSIAVESVRTSPETMCEAQRAIAHWSKANSDSDVLEIFYSLGLDGKANCNHVECTT